MKAVQETIAREQEAKNCGRRACKAEAAAKAEQEALAQAEIAENKSKKS